MRTPFAQRSAETVLYGTMFGVINERAQGLLCRADPHCRRAFYVAANELTTKAAVARNAHESDDHGYTHVQTLAFSSPRFGDRVSVRGRARKR